MSVRGTQFLCGRDHAKTVTSELTLLTVLWLVQIFPFIFQQAYLKFHQGCLRALVRLNIIFFDLYRLK